MGGRHDRGADPEEQGDARTDEQDVLVEGVPRWARPSLRQWLTPILYAVQDEQYHGFSGTPSPAFLMLVERRLRVELDWSRAEQAAINTLLAAMDVAEDLYLDVLQMAIDNMHLGYSVQTRHEAFAELERILTESGMAVRLDVRREPTGKDWHGRPMYREIVTLQRRTSEGAASAVYAVSEQASEPGKHLSAAWNHAYGRSPDPRGAYREAVMAVEAASIPIVSPNNAKATLGTVIRDLRSTPQRWQFVMTRDLQVGSTIPPIEVVTNMATLLWVNQTDRHAPVQPITQQQAEMAVHLALTLVHFFTRSITRVP